MDCHQAREALEEYHRGELPPDAAAAVATHLAGCHACRRLHDEGLALAARVQGLPRPATPPALRRRVARLARRGPLAWLARPWAAAAVSALVVALALSPWVRFRSERSTDVIDGLLQSGVAEHRRILLQIEAAPEVVTEPAVQFERVRSLTEIQLPAVFAGVGELRLLSARPTLLVNRKTAAAALRYPTSPVTTYFVLIGRDLPMPTERRVQIEQYRPYMRQLNGFHVVYWKQGDLAYLMVSGLDEEPTRQLFLKMRKAL